MNFKALSAMGLLAAAGTASAADVPTIGSVLDASGISVSGHISASYVHQSNTDEPTPYHQFDVAHNSFELQQVALTIAKQPAEGFGGVATFLGGTDARFLNLATDGTFDTVHVQQAFVQYASNGFTVSAGRLLTLAGAEVISPVSNFNFSRSLLFTNLQPLSHTGVRVNYAPSTMMNFTVGVNNGWNSSLDFADAPEKTLEVGVSVSPFEQLSIGLNGYFGNESGDTGTRRTLIDLVATYRPTDALTFMLNYDYLIVKEDFSGSVATLEKAKTKGIAVYGNWNINDTWRVALRLEQIKDDQYGNVVGLGADEKVQEATLTVGFAPSKNAELRFEVRQDKASEEVFFVDNDDDKKNQEFAFEALYKF